MFLEKSKLGVGWGVVVGRGGKEGGGCWVKNFFKKFAQIVDLPKFTN